MTAEQVFDKWCDTSYPMDFEVFRYLAITAMKEYARIKCLEAIKNTRYKAIDIIQDEAYHTGVGFAEANVNDCIKRIQNIPEQDVMPEL